MRAILLSALMVLVVGLNGCGPAITVSPPVLAAQSSDQSHNAASANTVRFLRHVSLLDHCCNTYFLRAGVEFTKAGRAPNNRFIFCGPATLGGPLFDVCFGFRDHTITIGVGAGFKEVERTLPPESFEYLSK